MRSKSLHFIVYGVLGYLTVVVAALYLAVIIAVGSPVDWVNWIQIVLLCGPFGSLFSLIAADDAWGKKKRTNWYKKRPRYPDGDDDE